MATGRLTCGSPGFPAPVNLPLLMQWKNACTPLAAAPLFLTVTTFGTVFVPTWGSARKAVAKNNRHYRTNRFHLTPGKGPQASAGDYWGGKHA